MELSPETIARVLDFWDIRVAGIRPDLEAAYLNLLLENREFFVRN